MSISNNNPIIIIHQNQSHAQVLVVLVSPQKRRLDLIRQAHAQDVFQVTHCSAIRSRFIDNFRHPSRHYGQEYEVVEAVPTVKPGYLAVSVPPGNRLLPVH